MIDAEQVPRATEVRVPGTQIIALGVVQLFAWGATFYLSAIVAVPIATDTGWPFPTVVGGLSLALFIAGVVSPWVGRVIGGSGSGLILPLSSLALGIGLVLLATTETVEAYLVAWATLGVGMGMGLYDAVFAALGREYGLAARRAITAVTLIAGFSSTLTWPLTAFLLEALGWRAAVLVHAGIQLGICLPLHTAFAPRDRQPRIGPVQIGARPSASVAECVAPLVILIAVVAATSAIAAAMAVYLPSTLQGLGFGFESAIAIAALVGASQVAGRLLELLLGRFYPPIVTLVAALILISAGLALILFPPLAIAGVTLYGAGIGIAWVARGTVPLSLVSREAYARVMGWVGLAGMISLAAAPTLIALTSVDDDPRMLLQTMLALAGIGLLLAGAMWVFAKPDAR